MLKSGTLVKFKTPDFKDYQLGWVVKRCVRDGGTIVYLPGNDLPYHEVCVKETDFIEPVKKDAVQG
jgi:hypothetical protein